MKKSIKYSFLLFIIILTSAFIYHDYNNVYNFLEEKLNNVFAMINNKANDFYKITATGSLVDENDLSNLEDSGITSNYTNNATYYPYYELLSTNEKNLYKQIISNAKGMATTFIPEVNVNSTEVTKVLEAVFNDHPELFWLDTKYSYKYLNSGKVVQIILNFNSTANDINTSLAKFNSIANTIINTANNLKSNYEKEKYVHDSIINLTQYDENSPLNQSAYSALVNQNSVCAGYSRAFQYIMIQLNIPTYYVTGYSNNTNHAWNIVMLSDGYYNVDLTWDDNNKISYNYFNKTDSIFSKTHTRDSLSKMLPSCTATNYNFLNNNNNINNQANNSNSNTNNTNNTNSNINTSDKSNTNTSDNSNTNTENINPPTKNNNTDTNNNQSTDNNTTPKNEKEDSISNEEEKLDVNN